MSTDSYTRHMTNVEQELHKIKRQADDLIWEEGYTVQVSNLERECDRLEGLLFEGVYFEPNF